MYGEMPYNKENVDALQAKLKEIMDKPVP